VLGKAFAKLTGLLEVNLGRNRIKSLSGSTFAGSAALEHIALLESGLSKFEKSLFKGLKNSFPATFFWNDFSTFDSQDR